MGRTQPAVFSGPFARVTIANFFFFLNFASFFLLPLYVKALGGSDAMVGVVMGTGGTATFLVLPLVGLGIDRIGRRRFLILGAAGMTLASMSYLWVDTIGPTLLLLRVLQGASFAAAFTATTTFAAEFAPRERRAQALGIFGLSTLLTHAIAPTVGEEVIRRGGFHTLFALTMCFTVIVVGLAIRLPSGVGQRTPGTVAAPWRVERLEWVVAATMVLSGMGFGTVITFIATFIHGEGLGRAGIFFAAYTSTAILTRFVGAGLSDSLGRRAVILPTLVVLAAAILSLAFVHDVPLLVGAGALFGSAQGISYPTMHAFLVDMTAEAHLGRAQALFNGAFNLGVTSSAFIFGAAAAQFGYRIMFALAALTPLLACGVFYRYGTSRPAPRPDAQWAA